VRGETGCGWEGRRDGPNIPVGGPGTSSLRCADVRDGTVTPCGAGAIHAGEFPAAEISAAVSIPARWKDWSEPRLTRMAW
jgi:hypothetical protein